LKTRAKPAANRARGGVENALADAGTKLVSEGLHVIRTPEHYGPLFSPMLHRNCWPITTLARAERTCFRGIYSPPWEDHFEVF
jgi:hypothetical protein